jgi:hypothetical protein
LFKPIPSNHRSNKLRSQQRSRGARLNVGVLQQIFQFINVARTATKLRVDHSNAPHQGLYLALTCPSRCKFMQLSSKRKRKCMEFDIIPAETISMPSLKFPGDNITYESYPQSFYIFSRHQKHSPMGTGKNWLLWDFNKGSVRLTSRIQPSCFVRIKQYPEDSSSFRLIIGHPMARNPKMVKLSIEKSRTESIALISPLMATNLSFVDPNLDQTESSYEVIVAWQMAYDHC